MVDQWLLPLGLGFTIVLVVATVLIRLYKRQTLWSVLLHGLAVILIGISLLGPMAFINTSQSTQQQKATLLVDASGSMSLKDGSDQTRFDRVLNDYLNQDNINALNRMTRLQFQCFANGVLLPSNRINLKKPLQEDSTRMISAIMLLNEQLPKDQPIILFSDGNDTDDPKFHKAYLRTLAQQHRVVHTVGLGKPVTQPTLKAYAWSEPSICQPGQVVTWHLQLNGVATLPENQLIHVVLDDDGRALSQFSPESNTQNTLRFKHQTTFNKPGIHKLDWHVFAGKTVMPLREITFVEVVAPPVNVLLLEGSPHWFTRNAARALQQDHQLNLTARYALGDTRELQLSDTGESANDALELDQREVIVLGQQTERLLNEAMRRNLYRWVSEGGGLLWLRGVPSEGKVWPKQLIPRDALRDQQRHELFGDLSLPFTVTGKAQNLLREKTMGNGRVILLDTSQLTLSAVGDRTVDLLALRLVGMVAKPLKHGQGTTADMQLDRHASRIGEQVAVTVTVRNAINPQLQITLPDGATQQVTLTPDPANHLKWTTQVPVEQAGYHVLTLPSHDNLQQAFVARPEDDEHMHLIPNHALLKAIARETGGTFFSSPGAMIDQLVNTQQQHLASQSQPIIQHRFNHPLLVILILGLWLGGWYVVRRKGGV